MDRTRLSNLNRKQKNYLIISIIILILIIGGVSFFISEIKPFLSHQIKQEISSATDSLYHLEFSDFHLSLFRGNITLDSLQLSSDTDTYQHLKKRRKAPNDIFEVFIATFKLRGVHLISLLLNKKLKIKAIKA